MHLILKCHAFVITECFLTTFWFLSPQYFNQMAFKKMSTKSVDLFECLTFCENKLLKVYFIHNIKVIMQQTT